MRLANETCEVLKNGLFYLIDLWKNNMNQYSLNTATQVFVKHYADKISDPTISKDVFNWISHKIRHSYWVLDAFQRIAYSDPVLSNLDKDLIKKMEIASLLHDIWRFYQHDKEIVLGNRAFNHWLAGFEILVSEGYTDRWILLATKYHNAINMDGFMEELDSSENNEAHILVGKAVRDADKLQNLLYFLFDWGKKFKSLDKNLSSVDSHIKDIVLNDFLSWKIISNEYVESFAEKVLNMWSWKRDINFKGALKILNDNDFDNRMFDILVEIGVSNDILSKISFWKKKPKSTNMKRHIDKLFNEMVSYVALNGIQKEHSHRKWNREFYRSKTVWEYRMKALDLVKENPHGWNLEERNAFLQWFGRKTTPYYWLKKELHLN